jgi:V/A-type H+-transporting ATPase subunit I
MSIIALSKITWYGLARDKEKALESLQELGCLHIIPLVRDMPLRETAGPTQQTQEALRFLMNTPSKRRQVQEAGHFNAVEVEKKVLELRDRIHQLTEERDFLSGRISALEPWGDFAFIPLDQTRDLRFWFYVVPLREMKVVSQRKGVWREVKRDHRFSYVVVISREEPEDMPVPRVHVGAKPLSELKRRLEEVEVLLEDLETERKDLSRWGDLFLMNFYTLENQAVRSEVSFQTHDQDQLFAMQAWVPKRNLEKLKQTAQAFHAACLESEPSETDAVPTLLENPAAVAGGQDLVTFYMTPGYRMWDPSIIVFFSFAVFFAMILSDAGYALLMTLFVVWKWKAMSGSEKGRRMRNMLGTILAASIVWGIMVNSYFGISLPASSILGRMKVLDLNDSKTMMLISISIGVFHIILANAMEAWRQRKTLRLLVPLGWIGIVAGGMLLGLASLGLQAAHILRTTGCAFMGTGAFALLFFSSSDRNILKRILSGLSQLGRLNSAFGDILSYLRLFALGLASASLAITFNGLARQVQEAIPGFGIIPAALIFILGHVLNLVLSLMSAVVHGLRLNVIEFFNWSMYEDGRPFRSFAKKGGTAWKH